MSSLSNLIQFQDAVCAALGIDTKKDRVVAIEINICPMALIEVQITRVLLTGEGEKLVKLLERVDWKPKAARV